MASLAAHARTLAPFVGSWFDRHPDPTPAARPWSTNLEDPVRGSIRLHGAWNGSGAETCFLLLHGLGGSAESYYLRSTARELVRRGHDVLRLSLRGADRQEGRDFYNVALTADLHAALASDELAEYEHLVVLGFSMGGHVALWFASEAGDARVRGVIALCTPLDLRTSQRAIDQRSRGLYRRHVLRGLKEIYASVARSSQVPTPLERVLRVRTIHEWDRLTIAPRYGYESPEAYYAALSVAPRLGRLRVPSLLVAGEDDPVVPAETIRPFLPASVGLLAEGTSMENAPGRSTTANGRDTTPPAVAETLDVAWDARTGHLGFPRDLHLGFDAGHGLVPQLHGWLESKAWGARS